jgi:HAE1 family hydrophobic/amphiphilic exporter-1
MTSFAFILGCIPLWTAKGSGAIGRRILGTVVIGGMSAASLIAIFLIPVTYAVAEGISYRLRRQPELQPDAGDPKGGPLA